MWLNEDKWFAEISTAANTFGVPRALVQAIIGAESQYNPKAYRAEVKINDASAGLMQILHATARGEGYSGALGDAASLTGLFDPATNIRYGTSFLSKMYRRTGGDVASTISAYNGGYRPDLGFGAKATKALRLCLARDKTGQCIQYRDVKPGEYGNQPYVDKVMGFYQYFQRKNPPPVAASPSPPAGGAPPPLDNAHRTESVEPESEDGGHTGGTSHRLTWTQVWEAIALWFRQLKPR